MKIFSSKRRMAVLALFIVAALFLLRPGASRLKSRIIASISAAVGRPVDIGAVHIQLLPRPGFDLDNLVVYDDPEFGAEPILRANEVTANLRLTSLLRGRLEISRLDMTEPSLNLVHSANGRWNLEALLEHTSQIPLAPTSKSKTESRPGFPYIEVSSGRINFKSGAEKRPYALTNADFSLWQESDNAWGIRLKAQPMRMDLNLTDTGILRINGTWQRAQTFRDTPLQFSLEWSHAQLGQFTKLFTGADKGWRGTILLDVEMAGSPANLKISSNASIDDFRRYDITSTKTMRLGAQCDGHYSSVTHDFHEVLCSAPVGNGLITLTGDMGLPGSHQFAVMLRALNVPASSVLILAERCKKNLPDDLEADGTLRADISMQENPAAGEALRLKGGGQFSDFRLTSAESKADIILDSVPFSATGGITDGSEPARARARNAGLRMPAGPRIEIGPVEIGSARPNGAYLRGWINREGYKFALSGETQIAQAIRLARITGFPVWSSSPEGTALLDIEAAGAWSGLNASPTTGFAGPQLTGSAKLRNVEIAARDLGSPIEIVSADMQVSADQLSFSKLNARAAGTVWTGSVQMPRGCGASCPVSLTLNANQIVLSQLAEWVNPSSKKRPWYRVLEPSSQNAASLANTLHFSGQVSADQLLIRNVAARHVSAKVSLEDGKLQISNLNADFLGGRHQGDWTADFSDKQALCTGSGKVSSVSLDGFAKAMSDSWIAGTASANYELSGKCFGEFWPSAEGTLRVEMRNGLFPHVRIADEAGALRVTHLSGQADLKAAKVQIKDARLDSPEGKFILSGSASFERKLDFKLTPAGAGGSGTSYAITGNLATPQVSPLTGPVQAKLKSPPPGK